MAKSMGQVKVPEARTRADSGDAVASVSGRPGRPALDLEQGAMKGNVLAQYKLERQRESRKKQKISSIRRAAGETGEVETWTNCLERALMCNIWMSI